MMPLTHIGALPSANGLFFSQRRSNSPNTLSAFSTSRALRQSISTGRRRPRERDAVIARFERGETLILSNVDLFSEGFDVPAIEAVLMLRPTKSLGLYLQMVGRALRPTVNKSHAIIIDLVGN